MDEKPKLQLVAKPKELKDASNFWRCCPISKEYLPETPCPEGKPKQKGDEPRCAWWINSDLHNYCFWRYVKDKSDEDGVMKELVQSELAALFGWSNTKTHFMLKQAIAELTEALRANRGADLLRDMNLDDVDNAIVVEDLVGSEPPESSE